MACRFEVILPGEHARRLPAARAALDEADRLEAQLSVFQDTSALVRINRLAADAPVEVEADLFHLLRRSAEIHTATDGAFDITSTPLSRCWGFMRREGRLPPEDAIADARALVGMGLVNFDAACRTVRFARSGVELNLGSIGKGYALDRMAGRLRSRGVRDALLSAGGSSILALGDDSGGGWPVDLRPRLLEGRCLVRLRLRNAALATSGAGAQFTIVDGRRYGHVLDPRTGWPAEGVLSSTVVAPDAAMADSLATAFLVDGPGLASRYCASHPGTLALLTVEGLPHPLAFGASDGVSLEDVAAVEDAGDAGAVGSGED